MSYLSKIEAYSDGTMSDIEQMLFEAELLDNPSLNKEWEAYQLTQELLNFTALNLPEEVPANPVVEEPAGGLLSPKLWMLAASSFVAIGIYFMTTLSIATDSKEEVVVDSSELQVKEAMQQNKIQEEQQSSIFIEYQETEISVEPFKKVVPTIQKVEKTIPTTESALPSLKVKKPIAKKKETVAPIAAASNYNTITTPVRSTVSATALKAEVIVADTKRTNTSIAIASNLNKQKITSKKLINSKDVVALKAGNSITFEPGFSAEAGSVVTAEIKSDD